MWSIEKRYEVSVFIKLRYLYTGNYSCRVQIWGLDHPVSIKLDIELSGVLGPKTEDPVQKMKACHLVLSCGLYMGGG